MYVHILDVSVYVGRGVCQKHRARNTPHASACGVYNVASVAIDFIRMGCTTIKSSWP